MAITGAHMLLYTSQLEALRATSRQLIAKGIEVVGEPEDEGWGITVMLKLPGGVEMMLYEPRHAVAIGKA